MNDTLNRPTRIGELSAMVVREGTAVRKHPLYRDFAAMAYRVIERQLDIQDVFLAAFAGFGVVDPVWTFESETGRSANSES